MAILDVKPAPGAEKAAPKDDSWKLVEILTDRHTDRGIELQKGAQIALSAADAKFLDQIRVAKIIRDVPNPNA